MNGPARPGPPPRRQGPASAQLRLPKAPSGPRRPEGAGPGRVGGAPGLRFRGDRSGRPPPGPPALPPPGPGGGCWRLRTWRALGLPSVFAPGPAQASLLSGLLLHFFTASGPDTVPTASEALWKGPAPVHGSIPTSRPFPPAAWGRRPSSPPRRAARRSRLNRPQSGAKGGACRGTDDLEGPATPPLPHPPQAWQPGRREVVARSRAGRERASRPAAPAKAPARMDGPGGAAEATPGPAGPGASTGRARAAGTSGRPAAAPAGAAGPPPLAAARLNFPVWYSNYI